MNTEAQWNIRETVQSLLQSGQVNLVALEGATEDIELQPFVDYPHRKPVELAADYLLKENKISGPIHAALTAQGQLPRFMGIDDAVHYQANIQAYRDSAPKLETARQQVKNLQAEIDKQKGRDFSVALRSFDQQVQGYRKGQVSLGDYVNTLVNATLSLPSPAIQTFLQALQMERTLGFHQVESERARLVEQLTGQLTPAEIQSLLAQTVAHRSGELGYGDFYAHLKKLCQEKGIRLSDYPAMDAYVRYVLLAEEINAENLLEDMAVLEKSAYARLAVTPEEKALVERSRQTHLMEKLVDFSLTPNEWRDYQSTGPHEKGLDLSSFESFYQEAEARDDAMSKNVMGALVSGPPSSVTVLVTGGFHAERMAHQLTQKGVTVLSYVPKINKIDTAQGSSYLSVFTQEKTPLEKLFQGEKLFLAQNPFSEFAERYLSFWSLAQAFWAGKGKVSNEERNELNKIKGAPPRAELHFVFDRGALYLKIGNKKFLIIGKDGTLFLGLNNVLPVQDTPVKSGGILWFLGGKLRPERSWWVETLALVFSGIVLVLVGQGFTQFGGDLSSWRGILSPIGLAMGGDVPSLLRVLGGLFIGAHVIEYAYYRIFKKGRSPALKNTVFSVLIAFPLFLIPFLDFPSLNSLLVAVVLKPLWHKTVNEWNSGQRPTIVSRPNPNTLTSWRVLVRDPMREQLKWFVGIIVGGTYLLASNLVLFVGGGFPLFFFALVAFGVLLTKKVVPIFLAGEHVSYSEEERKALLPIAEKISYWTLGAFILTYFALCPWGLNGIAETGQFFGFISSPPAKTFVLSAMAGYFVGLVKHMMHNYRTYNSLEGRPFQKNLLPLSRTAATNKVGPPPPYIKYPLNSSNRDAILSSYYNLISRRGSLHNEELVRDIVEKIKIDNNPFYVEFRSLLGDRSRLNTDFPLLLYLVNLGIFAPLHANPFGYVDPSSQRGERWVNLDPNGWNGMYYLGQPLYWSFGRDPEDSRWGNGDGIGILQQPVGFTGIFNKYFTRVSFHETDITVGPIRNQRPGDQLKELHEKTVGLFGGDAPLSSTEMDHWVEAGRIGDREALIQLLKDYAYARLVQNLSNGGHSNLVGLDAVVELTVSRDSPLRDAEGNILSPRTQFLMIAQKLSGLQAMLKYLSQNKQKKLALVIFYREMAIVYGTPEIPTHAGIIKMISKEGYKDESALVEFLGSREVESALSEVQKLILSLIRSNFVSDHEREKIIDGLRGAEKLRLTHAVGAPNQREPKLLPDNQPRLRAPIVELPDFMTFRVTTKEKSTQLIGRYIKSLDELFRASPEEKPQLIESMVADIRKLNPDFSNRYSGLLSETSEMASNPEFFLTLINFAIFIPLGYCIDSNSDPTHPPEGYFQINKKGWKAKKMFGQTSLYVSVVPNSPRAELARGVTLGVGVLNTASTENEAKGMLDRLFGKLTPLSIEELKQQNESENIAILSLLSQWVIKNSLGRGETDFGKKRALMISINHEKETAVIEVLREEAFTRAKEGMDQGKFGFMPVPLAMIRHAHLKNSSVLAGETDDTVLSVKTALTSLVSIGRFSMAQGETSLGTAQLLLFIEKLAVSRPGSLERKICEVVFGTTATPGKIAQELFDQGDWQTWLPWLTEKCATASERNFFSYEEQSAIVEDIQGEADRDVLREDLREPADLGLVRMPVSPGNGSNKPVAPSASGPDFVALAQRMSDEGQPLGALALLIDETSSGAMTEPIVTLAKNLLTGASQQASDRSIKLLSMGEDLEAYLSELQTTIQEFKRLSQDSPLGNRIYTEEDHNHWEAMIEVLQKKMMETIRISFPTILPAKLHDFSESLGFSDDGRQFLYHFNSHWTPGTPVLASDIRWGAKSDADIFAIHESILEKIGNADAFPIKREVLDETPKDVISFGEKGELAINGYEVVFPLGYTPPGYKEGFSQNSEIERAIYVALQIVSRHPNDIFDTRSGMGGLAVHKKHTLGHTVFVKFVGTKAFVLWVGPVNRSHGVASSANKAVDAEVTARAKKINEGEVESTPLMLRHFRPNGSRNGKGLNSFVLATSEMLRPMLVLFPILIFLVWLNAPLWGVAVAVMFVVGLKYSGMGKVVNPLWKKVRKGAKSDAGEDKISSVDLAKRLAEIMVIADNGNSPAAAERVIALLNGTSTRLNVESIVGPQGLGALAAITESAAFRDSDFQNQFPLEMGRVFPQGFPLVRARRAVGGLALDGTTQVGPGGLAADVDMKTKKGLVAVVTREMLKDLSKRVGTFEKAAQGKPVYWVAEDALVFQALRKIRPSANVLVRPQLIERAGAVVVVSGKTLERVVSSNRFLQDFTIALPKGTQVDMEGVGAASVLRNAVFFFLDELLSGMKVDFNTLRTIDTVARRIASAA